MKQLAVIAGAVLMVPVLLIGAVSGSLGAQAQSTQTAALDIPQNMLVLYIEAATMLHVPIPVLAAIGKVECDHDRNPACAHPNYAGACGPMQFLPATFATYKHASGSVTPSIYDERDSVFAAAAMLSADGVNSDPHAAIFAYNHSDSYVQTVLGWADTYAALGSPAQAVVAAARSYLGVPYLWGGTSGRSHDFQCSNNTEAR